MRKFIRFCLKTVFTVFKVRCSIEFDERNMPRKGVYVANHVSFLDPVLLFAFLPGDPVFALNGHLYRNRLIRFLMRTADVMPFNPIEPGDIKELIAKGYKEITLLGQNVNSYGKGLEHPIDFADLLNLLCEVPGDYQIRFMTSHPKDASHKLIDTIAAQPHLCKHIHLPVQSGSDRILKEMNRHYTVAQYMDLVNYAKEKIPGVTFSSDIIVGFPGETEEDFEATLELIKKVRYMQLFTFIYSKRNGTPAAKMPDPTTHAEKAARMERLLRTQDEIAFAAVAAMAGQTVRVLVEAVGRTPGTLNGRLDNNLVVEFPAPESLIGQWAQVHLTGSRAALLTGELVQNPTNDN